LHNLYNLQRDLLTVAATVLGKQDPVLTSMANQMELAKVKADRAFLHASDIMPHTECVAGDEQKQFTVRDISELVRQGQDLMVQV
ncbi:hypothetical protein MJN76_28890, partial [Salmonella enterica subsp. enterica serovar Anatum]|nr:hypothetical protein [Salmonella enterica subsp. enterica serovar Anatum]